MRLKFYAGVSLWYLLAPSITMQAQSLLNPRTQPQFVNPLPIPPVIDARNGGTFAISISQFQQNLGLVNPTNGQPMITTVWGYNRSYPGPTLLVKKDVPIDIFWLNNLIEASNKPLPHLLPVDESIPWAFTGTTNWQKYGVPIVTHVHGGHSESASDGLPLAWYTPGFSKKGSGFIKGDGVPYHYNNDQEAATIWYHDHAFGVTRLNVYAGLAGYYIITDKRESDLQAVNKLPVAPYDLGLAIQDRMFTSDGQLFYPSTPDVDEAPAPSVLPEMFGDFILVNGKAWPVLEVEPRQYRFRLLNGSDSRFYNLFFSNGLKLVQIAGDQGLLPTPVPFDQLLIAPGERKDVILDFSGFQNQTIMLRNNAKSPYPRGTPVDPLTTGRIMVFKVTKPLNTAYPLTLLPSTLRPAIVPLQTNLPSRKLLLFEGEDEYGRLKPMVGTVNDGVLGFEDAITENPALNTTEIWEFYNETEDAHPMHLHLVRMQLVSRQKFAADVNSQTGKPTNIRLLGTPRTPNADEAGWKDTHVLYPGEVTRVIATFDLPGLYVWHCHILSHEEYDMMRPFYVGGSSGNETTRSESTILNLPQEQVQLRTIPNPFNSMLKLQLNLPMEANLLINMYDLKGSLVKQVVNEKRSSGLQEFIIDGSHWPNGTYVCEVMINNQRLMRKLVLQK